MIVRSEPKKPDQPWTAERISFAMRGFCGDYFFEEVSIGRQREDIVFVSGANYLTVCEIKTSVADWKADFKKPRWTKGFSKYVKSFFFVVPDHLVDKCPVDLPDHVGIIGIKSYPKGDHPYIHRPCKYMKGAEKIPYKILVRWWRNSYYRLNSYMYRDRAPKYLATDVIYR